MTEILSSVVSGSVTQTAIRNIVIIMELKSQKVISLEWLMENRGFCTRLFLVHNGIH